MRHSGDGRTSFTNGAIFLVSIGEPIRTRYEIAAPLVNASEVFTNGAAISTPFLTPRLLYENMSRAEQVRHCRLLIFRLSPAIGNGAGGRGKKWSLLNPGLGGRRGDHSGGAAGPPTGAFVPGQ